ncbi:hypothetical protein HZC27_03500 [Candidatus Roizmanbacteria bacterium]|nr:hypothetical protein [Candidatus Roizmanbacteria bacterium]
MGAPIPEATRPEIRLSTVEKQAVFDWSPKRRQDVINNSKTILTKYLSKERYGKSLIDKRVADSVGRLWDNVIGCFQGKINSTPFLSVDGKVIAAFNPNILPTHSEYHVSKVLTLSTQLFDTLPEDRQSVENALAISLATIIHDTGSLLNKGEAGPQEKMYKFHELRAIALVDKVVNALYRDDSGDGNQQLKNKIKMLIAATIPKWNLDFTGQGTTLSKLLDPNLSPPVTYDKMMKDLDLNLNQADDEEAKKTKEQLRPQVDKLYMMFRELRISGDEKAIREMRELTHLMGAADHGAYMLEPSNIAEVFGLWQEQQTEWLNEKGELTHRSFTPGSGTSYIWLTSKFTDVQWKEFSPVLQSLGINPFVQNLSIHRSKEIADHIRSILRDNKSPQDALSRVEGAFSPVELDNLAQKLGLEHNVEIKNAIITFSHEFAHRFAKPHNFDALSTKVLKLMYDATPEKSVFLKEVFEAIIDDLVNELTPEGTLNIHIAPFAYNNDISSFTEQIAKAYSGLSSDRQRRVKSIFFTLREGKDNMDSIKPLIPRFKTSDKPPFGFALGGDPKHAHIIYDLMSTAGKDINTVVHFGLEDNYEAMKKRLDGLFGYMDATFGEELLKNISVHIDDKYEYFNQYLIDYPARGELLKKLVKSVSPLGYLLTRGQDGFNNYVQFNANFNKDGGIKTIPGSNNASMKGGYRIAVENLVQVLMNEGIINQ